MSGGGAFNKEFVGMKVSIVSSSNQVKDVEIFLNSTGKGSPDPNFSYDNNPKTHQSSSITWTTTRTIYKVSFLPSSWTKDGKSINLYDILTKNSYANLKTILEHSSLNSSVGPGDYILVEPMVRIGRYYGTAFELQLLFKLKAFPSSNAVP